MLLLLLCLFLSSLSCLFCPIRLTLWRGVRRKNLPSFFWVISRSSSCLLGVLFFLLTTTLYTLCGIWIINDEDLEEEKKPMTAKEKDFFQGELFEQSWLFHSSILVYFLFGWWGNMHLPLSFSVFASSFWKFKVRTFCCCCSLASTDFVSTTEFAY